MKKITRSLDLTIEIENAEVLITATEPQTGEKSTVTAMYSPGEHPEFDADIGQMLYEWLSMWVSEERLTYEQRQIIIDNGWTIQNVNCPDDGITVSVDIEAWSPAGEDLCETIIICPGQTLAEAARSWADSFSVDDHVMLWADKRGTNGVPSSIAELVDDAEAIQKMMYALVEDLEKAEKEDNDA